MANDDYWMIVFKLLNYYYLMMKKGQKVEVNEISAHKLGINNPYLMDVYRNLFEDGYLTGSRVVEYANEQVEIEDAESVRITTKGIEYLQDNSKMKQVYKIAKEVKSWLPGM